jgi:hypothetical protein
MYIIIIKKIVIKQSTRIELLLMLEEKIRKEISINSYIYIFNIKRQK